MDCPLLILITSVMNYSVFDFVNFVNQHFHIFHDYFYDVLFLLQVESCVCCYNVEFSLAAAPKTVTDRNT